MDEYTKHCWSIFLKHKSDLSTEMMSWLFRFQRDYKIQVKFFRCDNSGENRSFRDSLQNHEFKFQFEFTATNTPQQNGRLERKLATLYGKVRSLLNGARIP